MVTMALFLKQLVKNELQRKVKSLYEEYNKKYKNVDMLNNVIK